jgi:hypothetical protein
MSKTKTDRVFHKDLVTSVTAIITPDSLICVTGGSGTGVRLALAHLLLFVKAGNTSVNHAL